MKQSGMPSRRHMPSPGPVRLNKSDGQFSVKNILTKAFSPRVDRFTPGACLSATSTDRPNIRVIAPGGTCPSGYVFGGLDSSVTRNIYPVSNICVKSNYDTTGWTTVANCCNGVTAAKDCDPSLCVNSQGCRDKMTSTGWCNNHNNINRAECVTYLNADGNDDVKASILARNCTATDMVTGICRDYVKSGKAHGQMDSAVVSWCTDKIQKPLTLDQQNLIRWARYRIFGAASPFDLYASPGEAAMDAKLSAAVAAVGGDPRRIIYPEPTYYDNSQDPICSCILSQLNKTGEKSPPVACFDSKCQLSGYQTTGMKAVAANCPSWVECRSNILAASSGVVDNVKVTQTCGQPPPGTYIPETPAPTSSGGVKDDSTLLKEDEARAAGTSTAPIIVNTGGAQTLSQQLAAPFAPSLFGSASVAEVSILFFAMLILGAILWRSWMNRRATQLIAGQYEAALEYDRQQELADRTREIKESIAAMGAR